MFIIYFLWEYRVRLLRRDSQYVASVLALDWKLDKEEQELTAVDIANRNMLLLQLLEASKAGKEEQVQELVLLGADVTGKNGSHAVAPGGFPRPQLHGGNAFGQSRKRECRGRLTGIFNVLLRCC